MISITLKNSAISGTLPKQRFSKEAARSVREDIDLYDFCNWYAPELFDNFYRSECRLKAQHSLVVGRGKNFAHDFENGTTYFFFPFCKEFFGLPFYAALYIGHEFLTGEATAISVRTSRSTFINTPTKTPKTLENEVNAGLYFIDPTIKATYAYLCNVRHIDRRVVDALFHSKNLYLRSVGNGYNLCFPLREYAPSAADYGTLTGFEIVGAMSSRRFKSVVTARNYAYFAYLGHYAPSQPCELACFESVIDLLSFSTLIQTGLVGLEGRNLVLVSLRGLNYNIALKAQRDFNAQSVHFFVDNDEAGRGMLSSYGLDTGPVDFLADFSAIKDWNDMIHPDTISTITPTTFSSIIDCGLLPF